MEAALAPLEKQRDDLAALAGEIGGQIEESNDPVEIEQLQSDLVGINAEIAQLGTDIGEIRSNASASQGGSIVQFAVAPGNAVGAEPRARRRSSASSSGRSSAPRSRSCSV